MSTRGSRGGIRVPVHFRVAKIISGKEPTARQSGTGVEITLCVNRAEPVTTTRKRPGRPRKVPLNPIADATDVIYLSDAKSQGPPKHFPLQSRGGRRGSIGRTTSIVQAKRCPVHSLTAATTYRQSALLQSSTPIPITSNPGRRSAVKDDWPEDLAYLYETWDSLPESEVRKVVKWLRTPIHSQQPCPLIVEKTHTLVTELFPPSSDERLDEYTEWLHTKLASQDNTCSTHPKTPAAALPKVVVENQPSSLQNCCQWSSMTTTNQYFREA